MSGHADINGLAADRDWAPELFIGADALLSALKQVHSECGDALGFLGAELASEPSGRFLTLPPRRSEATAAVSYAVVEQAVDATVFFAFAWATLTTGGALVASGARVLISSNTWTPQKRKRFSPWRSVDRMVGEIWPPAAIAQERLLAAVDRALRPQAAVRSGYPDRTKVLSGSFPGRRYDPALDAACVRGAFRAGVGSPTKVWIADLIRRNPEAGVRLATLYGRYAAAAGFLKEEAR